MAGFVHTVKVKFDNYDCLTTFCILIGIQCLLSSVFAFSRMAFSHLALLKIVFNPLLIFNFALIKFAISLRQSVDI